MISTYIQYSENNVDAKAAFSTAQGATTWLGFEALMGATGSDNTTKIAVAKACKVKSLRAQAISNTLDGTCTITLMKNSNATALAAVITAGATTAFEDTTNVISFARGDTRNWRIVAAAGTGAIANIDIAALEVIE